LEMSFFIFLSASDKKCCGNNESTSEINYLYISLKNGQEENEDINKKLTQ